MTHLERDRLALALVLDDGRLYVAADDLGPLLARAERVWLTDECGDGLGSAYQDGAGMVRFLVFGGPCYAAGVDLVRGLLSMSTVPAVPVAEVEA
jgi:hypothetical protein